MSGISGLLESFATVDVVSSSAALASDSLGAIMREAKETSLSAIMALALAKGTVNDILQVVRLLLGQISVSGDKSAGLQLPVPQNLQTLTKMARGVTGSKLVVPTTDTFSAAWGLSPPSLQSVLEGNSAFAPTALVSDGTHLYVYVDSARTILKVGTGYNDSSAGEIVSRIKLDDLFTASSAVACLTHAPTSVQLVLPDNKNLLVVASPDPDTGAGSALRLVRALTQVCALTTCLVCPLLHTF